MEVPNATKGTYVRTAVSAGAPPIPDAGHSPGPRTLCRREAGRGSMFHLYAPFFFA
jgi:hypothetical protein